MNEKIYSFECRNHPEAPHTEQQFGTLAFDVRYAGPEEPKTVKCPLCGTECGVLGTWRETKGEQTDANDWRSKWCVAISVWEKVANELGRVKRAYDQLVAKKVEETAGGTKPTMPSSGGLN